MFTFKHMAVVFVFAFKHKLLSTFALQQAEDETTYKLIGNDHPKSNRVINSTSVSMRIGWAKMVQNGPLTQNT